MKQFIFVYNPVSGDAYFKYKLDLVFQEFQQHGCLLLPIRTAKDMDMKLIVEQAAAIKADGILVAGGDGTVHAVANAMLAADCRLPLGIIPSGTSNDLASFLQLDNDLARSAARIAAGKTRGIDVGQVNNKFFINVASAGLLAAVAHTADVRLKNTLGKMAYYLKGLESLPSFHPLQIQVDIDGTVIEEEVFLFLIANSSTVGGFKNIAPMASIDDGLLDLLLVTKCSLPELTRLFISFLTGSQLEHKNVIYMQGRHIAIECNEELDSDLDGELGPKLPLCINVIANGLRLFSD